MATRPERRERNLGRVTALTVAQRRTLGRLKRGGALDGLYLAGGVAVALHVGHRRSLDLDFFSSGANVDFARVRAIAVDDLAGEVVGESDATLKMKIGDAMVDFVRYRYAPLVRPRPGPEGVAVAAPRDLAAMKLAAIARRGIRRDFWDLYELLNRKRLGLSRVCDDYVRKFEVLEPDLYHVLRSLSWFDDAEADPKLPRGLTASKWASIREWFERVGPAEVLRRSR